jgi:hypothetical protein
MARCYFATWRGPTSNKVQGGMREWRGNVIHIADGGFEGTISWQLNPVSDVSSHFVVGLDGTIAQIVDTADTAWTQQAGNGHWISVENAGRTPSALTDAQVLANAELLAWAHKVHGVPLQLATSPDGKGLGHHSMGTNGRDNPTDRWTGPTWGHEKCPGPAIYDQKPVILQMAISIAGGTPPPQQGGDVTAIVHCQENGGYYAYPVPKWFLSVPAAQATAAAYGVAITEVPTLAEMRDRFGYVPGTVAMIAAGTADVLADAHGNVLPSVGGVSPAPSGGTVTGTFTGTVS